VTPRWAQDLHGDRIPIRTGDLEIHITADIAWAVGNHVAWTDDDEFLASHGRELLVETARYWTSRVEIDPDRSGHLRGVIGPDEYHEDVDDNLFTNVMVRHNLELAAAVASRFGGCDDDEIRAWRDVADALVVESDDAGIYEQFAGYRALEPLAVEEIGAAPISADALLGHDAVARTQIIKQPDVMMAYHLVPDLMDGAVFEQNLAFASERTAHGSSLSPAITASLCFRAGRWREAMHWFELAALLDLDDLTGTTAGGLHLATMGGLWQAVTVGLLGLRATPSGLSFDPHVPAELGPVHHRLTYRGAPIDVFVSGDDARVECAVPVRLVVSDEIRETRRHHVRRAGASWEHR
jgi:trehalose/maltose hydrolase-like predicted phosphorylase